MPIINPGTGGGTGPQGPQGIQGFPGIGFDGEPGEDGFPIPGSQGAQGSQGIQGVPGINGSQGIPGEDGLSGEDSFIPGPQGLTGASGTNGAAGTAGARGLDGEDGLVNDDFWPGFNPFIDDPLEQISRIQDQNLTIRPSYSAIVVGPYTINSGKKLTISSGGRFKIEQGAPDSSARVFVQQTQTFSNTGTAEVMAGLGTTSPTQIVTPKTSGTLLIGLTGLIEGFNATANITIKLYYGTGTPPAVAASAPPTLGIVLGNPLTIGVSVLLSNYSFPITAIVNGLTPGVAYWFDVSLKSSASSTTISLFSTNFTAVEL